MNSLVPILFVLAQAPERRSLLMWAIESLGIFYALALPAAGLAVFIGAILVVALSRRPSVIAAYLVFVPLPALIGIYGTVQGVIYGFSAVATAGAEISNSEMAIVWSTATFTTLVGLLVSSPSYLVVAVGLMVRAIARQTPKVT